MRNKKTSSKKNVRLPGHFKPERYAITVHPDLKKFTFKGEETITFTVLKADTTLRLHCKEIVIERALFSAGTETFIPTISYDIATETVLLAFKKKIPKGTGSLSLSFAGMLNDKMRGFYRSAYEHEGKIEYLATTQFESTFARQAFPCIDEPASKAVFDVTVIAPKGHMAISNTLPVEIREHAGGYQAVTFSPTPRMSTYLLAFIVGRFEHIESTTKQGTTIRIFATPGKKKQAQFALDVAIRSLEFYNDYFAIPYPLPVLDMIAIPDFAAGAMENWGAVTYRETALLVDPDHSSVATKQGVALTIAHELAHQWFGNLVTMEWWTDLWLNEGFASYAEYLALDHLFPEWQVWDQFVYEDYSRALSLDALRHTHPVEVIVHHPSEIDQIFDAVSYSKGASIIRMLAEYLGEKDFRGGLRHYLKKHSYKNAVTTDLWNAFEHVSKKPVGAMMKVWTGAPGYPVVVAKNKEHGLQLKQSRFFSSVLSERAVRDATVWPIPVEICYSGLKKPHRFLMNKKTAMAPALDGNAWLKVNLGQSGFFRTAYDHSLLHGLTQAIRTKKLPVRDRLGIVIDAFALAESGKIKTIEVFELLESYVDEESYHVWVQIAGGLGHLSKILEDQPWHEDFKTYARSIFRRMVKKTGWKKKSGETHIDSLMRILILNAAGKFGDTEVIAEAQKLFAAAQKGTYLDPDIRALVYALTAAHGGKKEYVMLRAMHAREKMTEQKNRIARALTAFKDKDLVRKTLDYSMSAHVRSQDAPSLLALLLMGKFSKDQTWRYVKKNWKKIAARFGGGHSLSRIIESMGYYSTKSFCDDAELFFSKHPVPGAERTLEQVFEGIRSNIDWLQRDAQEIKQWLSHRNIEL